MERGLLPPGERVLLAVSGGADSTALLLLLHSLRRSLGIELVAAYFDHMLRGRRVVRGEITFLEDLCAQLEVPFHVGQGDVRSYRASRKLSLEEAARDLRYAFLARSAHDHECSTVATGHTQDDQAETVLLRIIRGTGTRGLAAMAPLARMPGSRTGDARLARPLLTLTREDTERCCREAGVQPLEDATNLSRRYARNRVRNELLPTLRRYNPRIDEALVRLASNAAAEMSAIDVIAAQTIRATPAANDGTIRLQRQELLALPEGLQAHIVRAAIERLVGPKRSLSERHITAILRGSAKTGTRLDLPRGLSVEVQRDWVVLRSQQTMNTGQGRRTQLRMPGTTLFGPWSITTNQVTPPPARLKPPNGQTSAVLDADALGKVAWVRSRRDGDRYQPLGRTRSKKLQDVLVDAHVPRSERDGLPLVCSKRGIAWVVGRPPAEWAKVTNDTRTAIRLRAERA